MEGNVKYCKRFTEGIGYFACFLAIIFIVFTYFDFGKPVLDEETGLTTTFLNVSGVKEYIALLGTLVASLVICRVTDKLPFIGLVVCFVPLYFVFRMFKDGKLVFCPMLMMVLTIIAVAGEIVATGQWIRSVAKK